jgi:hypothetical protein
MESKAKRIADIFGESYMYGVYYDEEIFVSWVSEILSSEPGLWELVKEDPVKIDIEVIVDLWENCFWNDQIERDLLCDDYYIMKNVDGTRVTSRMEYYNCKASEFERESMKALSEAEKMKKEVQKIRD